MFRKKDEQGNPLPWFKRITVLGYILLATGTATAIVAYKTAEDDKKPILNVFQGPKFLNRVADSIPIILEIKNFGNANARNIDAKFISIDRASIGFINKRSLEQKTPQPFFIAPDGAYDYYLNFDLRGGDTSGLTFTFIYFRDFYTDENGEPQPDTIRRIFKAPYPRLNALIFDAPPDEFIEVQDFLVQQHEW